MPTLLLLKPASTVILRSKKRGKAKKKSKPIPVKVIAPYYRFDQVPEKLALARLWVAHPKMRPYMGAAVSALIPVATNTVDTLACDRFWRLYFNPEYLDTLSVEELGSVLLHELEHLLRNHHSRCDLGQFDHELFNVCGDFCINSSLAKQPGVILPKGVLLPQHYKLPEGLLAEEYYAMLRKNKQLRDKILADVGAGQPVIICGSCAHGHGEPWELPASAGRAINSDRGDLVRRMVAKDVVAHERSDPGSVPGSLRRWADDLCNPKIPWQQLLKSTVRNAIAMVAGMVDYSYQRPSRRQSSVKKIVLPSMVRPAPNIALVVDTSGSMSDELLAQALAEIRGVIRATGGIGKLRVLSVDAALQATKEIYNPRQVNLVGGGGTDMGVGVSEACKLKPRPQVIIVLTDGLTEWPNEKPPGPKVVVAILAGDAATISGPSWAKTVHVD